MADNDAIDSYRRFPLRPSAKTIVSDLACLEPATNKLRFIKGTPQVTPEKRAVYERSLVGKAPVELDILKLAVAEQGAVDVNAAQMTIFQSAIDPDRFSELAGADPRNFGQVLGNVNFHRNRLF